MSLYSEIPTGIGPIGEPHGAPKIPTVTVYQKHKNYITQKGLISYTDSNVIIEQYIFNSKGFGPHGGS